MPSVSKHDLIFASLNMSKPKQEPIFYRDYKNIDANLLNVGFHSMEWNSLYSITDSDILIEALNGRLNFLHDNCIPLRKCNIKINPCFNNEIETAIIARDIAYSNWKRSRLDPDLTHFKRLRNRVNLLIRDAKRFISTK